MIIFASKDLDKHGISHQSSSQLFFQGRVFRKGQTFAAHLRDVAIELAQENLTLGRPCIVIDYDSHVTLWRGSRSYVRMASQPFPTPMNDRPNTKVDTSSGKVKSSERSRRSRSNRTR